MRVRVHTGVARAMRCTAAEHHRCGALTAVGALLGISRMTTDATPITRDHVQKNRLRWHEGLQVATARQDEPSLPRKSEGHEQQACRHTQQTGAAAVAHVPSCTAACRAPHLGAYRR